MTSRSQSPPPPFFQTTDRVKTVSGKNYQNFPIINATHGPTYYDPVEEFK